MEETSTQAWHEFKGSEDYTRARNLVLSVLTEDTPLTGREICAKAGQEGLWKRLREMEREGLVEIRDKRRCQITGKKALTWVPKPIPGTVK